jgi:hypothetical protein
VSVGGLGRCPWDLKLFEEFEILVLRVLAVFVQLRLLRRPTPIHPRAAATNNNNNTMNGEKKSFAIRACDRKWWRESVSGRNGSGSSSVTRPSPPTTFKLVNACLRERQRRSKRRTNVGAYSGGGDGAN